MSNIITGDNLTTRRRETINRDNGELLYWVTEVAIEQMRLVDDSIEPFGYYIKDVIMWSESQNACS